MSTRPDFKIGGQRVAAGQRTTIDLPVSVLSDHTPVSMSVHVVHGETVGPTIFVSAAIHGDEVLGVEIVRRLLRSPALNRLRGTLLAIPVVNAFGFMNRARYLPDRRDLNRSFPGLPKGSLAARLAHLFMKEIVGQSNLGIDLHSATIHRTNLAQIRVSPSDPSELPLARVFGAPLILASRLREGSLRYAARERNVEMLVFEAGEGLRFDEGAIRTGVTGILRVMQHLDMIEGKAISSPKAAPIEADSSIWIRAPVGGLFRAYQSIGAMVEQGEVLGAVSDPFGEVETGILAPGPGLVIGRSNLPVVNEGDALFNMAHVATTGDAEATIDSLASQLADDPTFDEDEII